MRSIVEKQGLHFGGGRRRLDACEIVGELRNRLCLTGGCSHRPVGLTLVVTGKYLGGIAILERKHEVVARARYREVRKGDAAIELDGARISAVFDDRIGASGGPQAIRIGTGPAEQEIIAAAAVEHVVARRTHQCVGVRRTYKNIVAIPARVQAEIAGLAAS